MRDGACAGVRGRACVSARAGEGVTLELFDPGIGLLHVETPDRDSLACDLMEVCRAGRVRS